MNEMKEMEIIYLKTDEIIPYNNNPRNNDEAVEYVANSIKEFGFKVPIVIDENNVIVAGHTRLKASKRLGLEIVPCIKATDLNQDQIKAFRLADNKVSEVATWDFDRLNIELGDIEMDMSGFGFDIDINDFELNGQSDEEDFDLFDDIEKLDKHYGVPYQGNKSRIADIIINILPEGERLVDLFGGGVP
jgi:hypothetical protein